MPGAHTNNLRPGHGGLKGRGGHDVGGGHPSCHRTMCSGSGMMFLTDRRLVAAGGDELNELY